MDIEILNIWGDTERPWGYEIRVDLKTENKIYNEILTFKKKPTVDEINEAIQDKKSRIENLQSLPKPISQISELKENLIILKEENAKLKSEKEQLIKDKEELEKEVEKLKKK